MTGSAATVPAIKILGSRVHMIEIPDAVTIMDQWIANEGDHYHYVVNTGMHGIMVAHRDSGFKAILNAADLFCPDGILVVMLARLHGHKVRKRLTGPELVWEFCKATSAKGYKHFFYGDTEETLQLLADKLQKAFPSLQIVGLHSPPFRPLSPEEDEAVVREINQAGPDVLWVGLGAPKQERWLHEHRDRLSVPVAVGAGASFKFLGGATKRAPAWIRNSGLEWSWRLAQEPTRVWRRVFIDAPQFIGLVVMELTGLRKRS